MPLLIVLAGAVSILGVTHAVMAQTTANSVMTVTINSISELALAGGSVSITVNSATAGSEPEASNTDTNLNWSTNASGKKVTVATNLSAPKFTLKVLVQSVTGGTAASEVTLSTTATDFITAISNAAGGCELKYTAVAAVTAGTGTDFHTITYTLRIFDELN